MKFVISILILYGTELWARPIRIYHERNFEFAARTESDLLDIYKIPQELISTEVTFNCALLNGKGKLDLCLKKNGDLEWVSVDKNFLKSLRVFWAPEGTL
jgi:hypothetical protein